MTYIRHFAMTFTVMILISVIPIAAAQDIVIDSGTDETVISRLPAAPPQEEPMCSDSADGTLGPCAGETADDRFSQRIQGGLTCQVGGCTFVTASGPLDVPAGKTVLFETVTMTYDINGIPDLANFVSGATASFQTTTPFQRFFVGEMMPVVFTGAIGMTTKNLNLYGSFVQAVVTFPDERPVEGTNVVVAVYVSGRLIDAPTP